MKKTKSIMEMIKQKECIVGVIGLGYVGLPLAITLANKGFKVIGYDIDKHKINKLLNSENYINDIKTSDLKTALQNKLFIPINDSNELKQTNIIVVCVPTPLNKKRKPDLTYLKQAAEIVSQNIKKNHVIIFESTTYPGTTEKLLKKIIEKSGLNALDDFFLSFSPERIDPSNKYYNVNNTPKIVGGIDKESTQVTAYFYQSIIDSNVIKVTNTKTAEMAKILENTYRLINIALIFEMSEICNKLKIDIWEVIDAAKTKPYGFQAFYPGPGVGGHCIPIDPIYLSHEMKKHKYKTQLIDISNKIVSNMPNYIVNRIKKITKNHKLNDLKILLIGMSYKKDVDDLRESPSLELFKILQEKKAQVDYYDPYIDSFTFNKKQYKSVAINKIKQYDLVVICVDHSNLNYKYILDNSKLIFDLKNVYQNNKKKVIKL